MQIWRLQTMQQDWILTIINLRLLVFGTDHALNTSTENTSGIITVKKQATKFINMRFLENGQAANRVLQAFNGCRGSIKLARYKVLLRLFLLMITLT